MKFLSVLLVVFAIGTFIGARKRANNLSEKGYRRSPTLTAGTVVVLACLVFAFLAWRADDSTADEPGEEGTEGPAEEGDDPIDPLFECPDSEEDPDAYEISEDLNYGHEDDGTRRLATASGETTLVGNGPPLNNDAGAAAAEDLFARTAENPMLTAQLAYAFRLEGFTPDQEEIEAVSAAPAAYIHQLTGSLLADEGLWVQTRINLCLEVAHSRIEADWKDRDVLQFASRPGIHSVTVGEQNFDLPVHNVPLRRDPRPDGVDLLWMTTYTSDSRDSRIDVAVDMEYVWVTTFGEVPENLEEFPQDEDTTTDDSGPDDTTGDGGDSGSEGGDTGGGSGGDSGGDNGGHGGGEGGGCGGTGCGTGGGDSGGDGGSGCGNSCGGGGDNGGDCGGCSSTTAPPTTTATTRPPATTTPPTTAPPTTAPPTTQPPPPVTPTTKAPDPGCGPPVCG